MDMGFIDRSQRIFNTAWSVIDRSWSILIRRTVVTSSGINTAITHGVPRGGLLRVIAPSSTGVAQHVPHHLVACTGSDTFTESTFEVAGAELFLCQLLTE